MGCTRTANRMFVVVAVERCEKNTLHLRKQPPDVLHVLFVQRHKTHWRIASFECIHETDVLRSGLRRC